MHDIDSIIKTLPISLQKAIRSPDIYEKLEQIGKEYGFHLDQLGELDSETRFCLLGITKPENFSKNIASRLGIDIESANKVANAVSEKIFLPIKEMARTKSENKEEVLAAIENPDAVPASNLPEVQPEQSVATTPATPSFIDQKLGNIVTSQQQETLVSTPVAPPKPNMPPAQPYKVDPYREPAE